MVRVVAEAHGSCVCLKMIAVGYPPPEPFLTRFGGATELGTFLWIQLRGFFAQDEGGADDDLHVTHQPSLPCSMVYDCARVFDARLTTVCAQCSPIHFCRCNCNTPRSLSLSSCFIDCYFKEQVSKTRSKKVCTTYTHYTYAYMYVKGVFSDCCCTRCPHYA